MALKNNRGFILVLTLSIIGLSMLLVTYMVNNGRAFVPYAKTMIEREKARMLALSGIEIAMSQLSLSDKIEKPTGESKGAAETKESKSPDTLFSLVVPRLNVWQKFKLTSTIEGMQGEIGLCLMSEEGKLNINELFDPETGELIASFKTNASAAKSIQDLFGRIDKLAGSKDSYKSLGNFFKNRKSKLDDITELLTIKEFDVFKDLIFYDPPGQQAGAKEGKRAIYLTDVFTIWSGKKTIQPWLFSDSMCAILDLKRAQEGIVDEKQKIINDIQTKMPETLSWPDGWNKNLKLLYGKDFASLPKDLESLLETKFEPTIFSVLGYGKVGRTTQRLFAILERTKGSADKDKKKVSVKLKKLYWL